MTAASKALSLPAIVSRSKRHLGRPTHRRERSAPCIIAASGVAAAQIRSAKLPSPWLEEVDAYDRLTFGAGRP
jgi:hypothetical protein